MVCHEGDGPCVTAELCECTFQSRRGEEKEKEKYKQSMRWRTDRRLGQIKLGNESVENQVDVDAKEMNHQVLSDGITEENREQHVRTPSLA